MEFVATTGDVLTPAVVTKYEYERVVDQLTTLAIWASLTAYCRRRDHACYPHGTHHPRQPSAIPQRILLRQKLAEEHSPLLAPVAGNAATAALAVCFSLFRTSTNCQNYAERYGVKGQFHLRG